MILHKLKVWLYIQFKIHKCEHCGKPCFKPVQIPAIFPNSEFLLHFCSYECYDRFIDSYLPKEIRRYKD